MTRSEINRLIQNSKEYFRRMNFQLPPWAYWNLQEWRERKGSCSEVIDNMLGWDLTDFGSGDFLEQGLILFTLRNGNLRRDQKPYAEKIMIVEELQETPMHFHWIKMEDIINRGGGNLVIELYGSTKDDQLSKKPFVVRVDGVERTCAPGEKIVLTPGESICLYQGLYHRFYGEAGKGKVLVGEVSMVNDDATDNRFLETVGRFPEIEEDELPLHLLASDYAHYL